MIATARHPAFVAHAPGFDEVTGDCPRLSLLAEVDAHEGPVYLADEDALYFTTLPRPGADRSPSVQIKRLALAEPDRVSVLVDDADGANGMTADADGHLIVCEQGSRWEPARISRVDRRTGERETRRRGLARAAVELAQRRRGSQRRRDLVHRPFVRSSPGLPARADGRGLRVPPRPGDGPDGGRRRRLRQAQRDRALARRTHPVRHRQRRQPGARQLPRHSSPSRQGLRRGARPPPRR